MDPKKPAAIGDRQPSGRGAGSREQGSRGEGDLMMPNAQFYPEPVVGVARPPGRRGPMPNFPILS
ncbi:MAG: hypothetical protein F6J93_12445 [Oscillatoria sp. SIO1A7]|nr:hypothetical protein [Oscillatoria sp. SIO1A7]